MYEFFKGGKVCWPPRSDALSEDVDCPVPWNAHQAGYLGVDDTCFTCADGLDHDVWDVPKPCFDDFNVTLLVGGQERKQQKKELITSHWLHGCFLSNKRMEPLPMPGIWETSLKIQVFAKHLKSTSILGQVLTCIFWGGTGSRRDANQKLFLHFPSPKICVISAKHLVFQHHKPSVVTHYAACHHTKLWWWGTCIFLAINSKRRAKSARFKGSLLSIAESTSDAAPFFLFLTRTDQRKKC